MPGPLKGGKHHWGYGGWEIWNPEAEGFFWIPVLIPAIGLLLALGFLKPWKDKPENHDGGSPITTYVHTDLPHALEGNQPDLQTAIHPMGEGSEIFIDTPSPSGGMKAGPQAIVLVILLSSIALPCCQGDPDQGEGGQGHRGEKIELMVVGRYIELLRPYLDPEPSIDYVFVPFRLVDLSAKDAIKFLRLYFPRTYQEMEEYDVLILNSPEYQMFTPTQDRWMYDAIEEGMGGINAGSVFSIIAEICQSWANSRTSTAFPNDAVTVAFEKGGGEEMSYGFMVTINDAYPSQVLQPYLSLYSTRMLLL